jgi:uncharacterized membrane protein YedE/YeeE
MDNYDINNVCDTKQTTVKGKGLLVFFFIGLIFGITMTKSEAISWYRIFEMFRIESFHMYGIIGVALIAGVVIIQLIKKFGSKNIYGERIAFSPKDPSTKRYLFGGIIFGLGWALSGACPGPMFTLLGNGIMVFAIVILSAMLGTFVYGLVKDKLPH